MFYTIFIQFIGVLGMAFGLISYQMNQHKKIMLFKTLSESTFALQFLLLGSYTGLAMNAIGIIRNLTFARVVNKNKNVKPYVALFSFIMIAACAFTWEGYVSLLAVAGKLCTTIAYSIKSPKYVRLFTVPSCILWMIYDVLSNSFAGILTEVFGLCSIFVAYFRYDFKRKSKSNAPVIETNLKTKEV